MKSDSLVPGSAILNKFFYFLFFSKVLTDLNLWGNDIGDEGAKAIQSSMYAIRAPPGARLPVGGRPLTTTSITHTRSMNTHILIGTLALAKAGRRRARKDLSTRATYVL